MPQDKRGSSAVSRRRTDLCNHGAIYGRSSREHGGHALFGCAKCIAAGWNDPDVLADGRLPSGAVAEAHLKPPDITQAVILLDDRYIHKNIADGQFAMPID
jgi:hypothetical protein